MSLEKAWTLRSARERALMLVALLIVVGGGGYEWLATPIIKGRAELSSTLPQLRAESLSLTQRLEAAKNEAAARAAKKQAMTEVSLRESLALSQLSPKAVMISGERAEISFSAAEPAAILRWAAEAPAVFGVSIKQLGVTWKDSLADVRLQLAP
jgi:type II secretory pathway component PulM